MATPDKPLRSASKWIVIDDAERITPEQLNMRADENLRRMDKNGDGVVTRDEFTAAGGRSEDFDHLDRDNSGALSLGELGFDTAVVPKNYLIRGFAQAPTMDGTVDEKLELDYRCQIHLHQQPVSHM